jgi:hypothetical protein
MPRIKRFEESRIVKWVNIITIIISAVFLIGPILALYFAQEPAIKLFLIAIFTAGFSASIVIVTNARRPEVFAATAT